MLTAFKLFLRLALIPVLYLGTIIASLVTIFKNAEVGLFLMIAMIPQPNVWYKLHDYPFGKDFMDILFFSMVFGIMIQKRGFVKTASAKFIYIFIIISYLSLWNTSMNFSLPLPLTTNNFLLVDLKNYIEMILLYFVALNLMKEEKQQKFVVVLMSVIILLIAIRSYRNFTGGASFNYDKRVGGPFEAVGLGPNHLGAFIADYCGAFLGVMLLDKNFRRRMLYGLTVLFSLHPLFYSYSRGAYLAFFSVLTFYAVVSKRALLIVVATVLLAWQTILPASVVDRITMTENNSGEIEASAAHRLDLWELAMELFEKNPVFGVGYGGFGLSVPQGQLTDTHNFYMKTLSEQGVIGIITLSTIFFASFRSGFKLLRRAKSSFHKGLGLGFMGCIIALMISNIFGDRWSYFVLGSYFWILWGTVDRSIITAEETQAVTELPVSAKEARLAQS